MSKGRRGRVKYSAAELRFIEARQGLGRRELHAAFVARFKRPDVALEHIKCLCVRKGWTTRRAWSAADDALLRARYADESTQRLATELRRSLSSTYQRAYDLDLEKSAAYLASPAACRLRRGDNIGASSRFPKGHVPANKGVKRPKGWAPGRMRDGQFKKGERQGVAVTVYKPIGTERLSKEGYVQRKVNDGKPEHKRWRAVQLINWEAVNGPLPNGMVLKCLDGNRLNVEASNWTPISRAMLARLCGRYGRDYDHAPADLKPTIMAVAKVEHAVLQRRRKSA